MSPLVFRLLPPIRDVIAKHDLRAKKALGQHFLCDFNLTRRIAAGAGDLAGCTVFEIGPGPGGLTRALLDTDAKKIIALEKDRRCIAALADLVDASEGRLDIIEGDALKMDLTELAPAPRAVGTAVKNVADPLDEKSGALVVMRPVLRARRAVAARSLSASDADVFSSGTDTNTWFDESRTTME